MYNEQLEALISAALADGVLTEKEKQILFKRAQSMGIDLDEFEMVLDARLVELQKAEKEKAKKEKTEKSAPKSTKYGDVRKCPVCGALVPALSGSCPDCGYEFSGVDANLSSQKLAALIDKILQDASTKKTELKNGGKLSSLRGRTSLSPLENALHDIDFDSHKRIRNTIENFTIPNTKSDLFEFTISLQAKINDSSYGNAYLVKLEECVAKIKLLFPNDPMFASLLSAREEKQREIRNKKKKIHLINLPLAVILSVIVYRFMHLGVIISFWTVMIIFFVLYLYPLSKTLKKA